MTTNEEDRMTFRTKVDLRSRSAMTTFLADHERYDTMSSWNRMTSYANNLKLHNVIPHALLDAAYKLHDAEGFYDPINDLIADFALEHGWTWQAGFNGRSGGYLVLYRGERKVSEHKSVCTACGQRNFRSVDETGARCGRCGRETRVDRVMYQTSVHARGLDDDEDDFEDWDMGSLRDRVRLVQSFDQLCDDIVATVIGMCTSYEAVEETVLVPQTRTVLREID